MRARVLFGPRPILNAGALCLSRALLIFARRPRISDRERRVYVSTYEIVKQNDSNSPRKRTDEIAATTRR